MEIKYSAKAAKQLRKIAKNNRKNAVLIIEKIEKYAANPKSKFNIKYLKGKYAEFKRIRVGNFRIIFNIEDETMLTRIIHKISKTHDRQWITDI